MCITSGIIMRRAAIIALGVVLAGASAVGMIQQNRNKLQIHDSGTLKILTMGEPGGARAGVGIGGRIRRLPTGCVVLRSGPAAEDYRPIIWPPGTELSHQLIATGFGKFRLGQSVTGDGEIWRPKMLKPSKAVTEACPATEYIQVGGLHRRQVSWSSEPAD
jgi:hypothetical protein